MRSSLWALLLWAVSAGAAVDLNRASQAELESLPGIGPAKAEAILAYRAQHGPFRRLEDLQRVPGFGPVSVNRLRSDLRVVPPQMPGSRVLQPSSPTRPPIRPVVAKPGQK